MSMRVVLPLFMSIVIIIATLVGAVPLWIGGIVLALMLLLIRGLIIQSNGSSAVPSRGGPMAVPAQQSKNRQGKAEKEPTPRFSPESGSSNAPILPPASANPEPQPKSQPPRKRDQKAEPVLSDVMVEEQPKESAMPPPPAPSMPVPATVPTPAPMPQAPSKAESTPVGHPSDYQGQKQDRELSDVSVDDDFFDAESEASPDIASEEILEIPSLESSEKEIEPSGLVGGVESTRADTVHFSAYYPKEIKTNDWQPLHAYIYRQFAENLVLQDVKNQLGEKLAEFRRTTETTSQKIEEGAIITATPHVDGFQFNPPTVTIGFFKDWHRLDFELRAVSAPLNIASNGQITFTVEGIIIADIPLSIFVGETISETQAIHTSQKIYEAIFASYSHQDMPIVERVERACKSLGLDYLRDVTTLKSGQHWSNEIFEMIEKADIFQLFWSPNAAQSDYVRKEWEHALKAKANDPTFIRPVYWIKPMTDVPQELSHLHFAYQPDLTF